MAGYSAIADAGETLVELLRTRIDEMADVIDVDRNEIGLASPGEMGDGSDLRLSVYLYRVAENGELMNAREERIDDDTYRPPPLALDLYYLLTAHPSGNRTDETDRAAQQHRVLGLAMQVMRDNAVVTGDDLQGSLADEGELRVSPSPQAVDETTNIWATFPETPLRPSVAYLAGPVLIESTREESVPPVLERTVDYSVDTEPPERERTRD